MAAPRIQSRQFDRRKPSIAFDIARENTGMMSAQIIQLLKQGNRESKVAAIFASNKDIKQ